MRLDVPEQGLFGDNDKRAVERLGERRQVAGRQQRRQRVVEQPVEILPAPRICDDPDGPAVHALIPPTTERTDGRYTRPSRDRMACFSICYKMAPTTCRARDIPSGRATRLRAVLF